MSKDIKDLVSLIDMRGLECLNEQTGHSIKNAIEEVEISKFSFITPAMSEFKLFCMYLTCLSPANATRQCRVPIQ
jgi:hypothetical protein